ncbi:alpha/beta hydrolase [Streptomyces poriferorum]|uniref:Alpha/beta hydrolase n=1 Tax=Streptomyces poriferorum TaxID=2798799 RepID=A0ABY9IH00_9ACTN|nr:MULTISPECIES: alpha/beta hydrolase [unclassified Streptomyces]MDP5316147.1 alpha/beta hydrolase [Streptomyces sp. Alt4]WLQ54483.1 alpha/beta hydrolase [Streptomyces sp. Alt2]
MAVGYLVTVVLAVLIVVFCLVRIRGPKPLFYFSYRLGLVFNEIPHVVVYALVASTALAYAEGDIATTPDRVSVGVAVVAAAGLVVVGLRGVRAASVVRGAVDDALGAGTGTRRRPPLARILLRPVFRRRRDVKWVGNLSYGDGGRRNLLDVYHHRSRPEGGSVMIHFHGGHYDQGRKDTQSLPLLYRLAGRGWVCISANYRLRPDFPHPAHLIDAKKVIAWAREHAAEYGAAPAAEVFVAGSSAGGHMAAQAALTPNEPAYQPGFEEADTSVAAAIVLNGFLAEYFDGDPATSPVNLVRADAPPVLIAHGDLDELVDTENPRALVTALRSVSTSPVVYVELPGAHHAFDLFHSFRFEALIDGIEDFTAWVSDRRKST